MEWLGLERGISKAVTGDDWVLELRDSFAFLSRAICIKDSAGKWRPFRVGIYVGDEAARPIRGIQVSHKARKIVLQESRVPTGREKIRTPFAGQKIDTLGGNQALLVRNVLSSNVRGRGKTSQSPLA